MLVADMVVVGRDMLLLYIDVGVVGREVPLLSVH